VYKTHHGFEVLTHTTQLKWQFVERHFSALDLRLNLQALAEQGRWVWLLHYIHYTDSYIALLMAKTKQKRYYEMQRRTDTEDDRLIIKYKEGLKLELLNNGQCSCWIGPINTRDWDDSFVSLKQDPGSEDFEWGVWQSEMTLPDLALDYLLCCLIAG